MDETNAYYAEQVLGNKYTLEKLIEAEPTLKEKILNFFKYAAADYADVPKLSGAAKRYCRTTHRILMPDGSQFVYEEIKTDAEPTGSDVAQKSKGPDISSASKNSISQFEEKSNGFDKNSLKNSSDKQFALPLDEEGISGAEVLSWFENRSKGDGKIDLEATVAKGLPYRRGKSDLTVGELRKVIANSTHEKVYSKKDALRVVNNKKPSP